VREELRACSAGSTTGIHVTTILLTHDQEEAMAVADRAIVMNQGKLERRRAASSASSRGA
jgi:sulfate transport system ATP-binding protein